MESQSHCKSLSSDLAKISDSSYPHACMHTHTHMLGKNFCQPVKSHSVDGSCHRSHSLRSSAPGMEPVCLGDHESQRTC